MDRDKTPIQEVMLQTGVEKLCNLIDSLEMGIILVGHSKNGIMISQMTQMLDGVDQ